MPKFSWETAEKLKQEWTDRLVTAKTDKPELKRFEGKVGRVVTVNWAGKAIVDFADGSVVRHPGIGRVFDAARRR